MTNGVERFSSKGHFACTHLSLYAPQDGGAVDVEHNNGSRDILILQADEKLQRVLRQRRGELHYGPHRHADVAGTIIRLSRQESSNKKSVVIASLKYNVPTVGWYFFNEVTVLIIYL